MKRERERGTLSESKREVKRERERREPGGRANLVILRWKQKCPLCVLPSTLSLNLSISRSRVYSTGERREGKSSSIHPLLILSPSSSRKNRFSFNSKPSLYYPVFLRFHSSSLQSSLSSSCLCLSSSSSCLCLSSSCLSLALSLSWTHCYLFRFSTENMNKFCAVCLGWFFVSPQTVRKRNFPHNSKVEGKKRVE